MKHWGWIMAILLLAMPAAAQDTPEKLLGLSTDSSSGKIILDVVSSGCTQKGDFRVELKDGTLNIYRLRRDDCKAMPSKTQIEFSLEELGLSPHQPFRLGNLIVVNEFIVLR